MRSRPHFVRAPRAPWADDEPFLERCAAELRAVAPTVWAEIAAFAGFVGVPPARGLFLRAGTLPHGCSAFAWRLADGRVIAGRNYDFVVGFPNRHLLDTRPGGGLAHLGMNGGMVAGGYDGVNERGLFVALHKVMAQRPERVDPGLPPHLLVRAALETCADAGEAARLIAGVPHLAPFNYTLADPAGRLIALECYPGLPVRARWCARAVAVANHYAHPSLAPLQGRRPLASSRARAELMRRLPPTGADPWRAAQFVLADHSAPVCAHREHGSTLWSGVFDLTERRAAYAFGAPCIAPFVERPFPGVAAEMVQVAGKDKGAPAELLHRSLARAEREAGDERDFVKKAVSWTIREIGQRGPELNQAAVTLARRLQASEARAARWVGGDALRELTGEKIARRVARRGA